MSTAAVGTVTIRRAPVSEPPPQTEPRARHLRLVPDPPQLPLELPGKRPRPDQFSFAPQRSRSRTLPPLEPFAEGYARAAAEVLTGHRGVELLAPHTTMATMEWIRSLAPGAPASRRTTLPAPVILRVITCEVLDGVCEATAIVQRGPRVRAMTLRFVGLDRRWQCSHLEVI
ncbi:hypothetical protein EK0264_15590 [Epidermidibacterium keratini]|uniref:3-hydroxyacyl-CoA dehydrogenase n=1 Tax=Epidermidibacterium keratini TaxID=1891644 RepID=A0A7L4YRJ5_9ACTN|nr:Rv3235 family protein [Epidermidibacterium keratini]QHC01573.1 hypothetical protein EK0264_15590 [Epidermidibacterium keratini]